jgi:hypothetical protein
MNKTFLERKSVYHVPGTNCLLCSGIDTHSCERHYCYPVRSDRPTPAGRNAFARMCGLISVKLQATVTGTWSLSVTRNLRLTFRVDTAAQEICDVNLED